MKLFFINSVSLSQVEVVNQANRKINLGALRIGGVTDRSVRVVNNSLAAIDFCVAITPASPELQKSNILSIAPSSLITLKPKATTDINVIFAPKSRIPSFSEEVRENVFILLVLLMNI